MKRIDNMDWKYTRSEKTNVLETLRRCGFEPPSEDKRFQEKWERYKHALAISEGVKNG